MNSRMFNSIKRYYDEGRYTKEQVGIFVKAKWIEVDEYKTITGEDIQCNGPNAGNIFTVRANNGQATRDDQYAAGINKTTHNGEY
jgi:phage uncharacterized protein, XkdX family